jgi:protocatechuate 3,4-dioxygenase beta subunit
MLSLLPFALLSLASPQAPGVRPAEGVVEGRVVEEGTAAPVANARVTLMPLRAAPPPAPAPFMGFDRLPTATTDEQGGFRFDGVAPGRYRLAAQKSGFVRPFGPGPRPMSEVEVTTPGGATPVELVLQRGAVIAGRVVDAAGEPVIDARVTAMRPGRMLLGNAPPEVAAAAARIPRFVPGGPGAQTNDLGEFRLHSLAPGEYVVQAAPRPDMGGPGTAAADTAMVATFHPDTTSPDDAQSVTVAAGQTVSEITIRMAHAPVYQVSGVVVDEAGQPLADALVRLTPDDPLMAMSSFMAPGVGHTDASGAFSFPRVERGAYTVIAVAPVVIAHDPAAPRGMGSTSGTTFVGPSGTVTGRPMAMVTTETRQDRTVRYRDVDGTRAPITVDGASITGLRLVVRRAPAQ